MLLVLMLLATTALLTCCFELRRLRSVLLLDEELVVRVQDLAVHHPVRRRKFENKYSLYNLYLRTVVRVQRMRTTYALTRTGMHRTRARRFEQIRSVCF
jgi:hypothetical protein